jgi:transcriptional regulator with XRE-family HTH domain
MLEMGSMTRGKNKTFSGVRLQELRKKHNITQDELAAKLKIGQAQINRYEQGKHAPSVATVIALAQFFAVTTDYLFGLTDDMAGNLTINDLSKTERDMLDALRRGDWVRFHRLLAEVPQQSKVSTPQ